jgi:hypothetical protein
MDAAGLLSLLLMDRDGEPIPANVERFDGYGAEQPSKSPELLFALLIWSVLTANQQDRIRRQLRGMVYCSKEPNAYAVQLHNMLEGRA